MKFLCPSCKAKYQISDEKVAGRSVRMKCRKCGHMIQVSSEDAVSTSSAPPPNDGSADMHVSEAPPAVSAVAQPPPKPNAAPVPAPRAAAPPAPSAAKSRVPAPKAAPSAALAAPKPATAIPGRTSAEKAAEALRVPRAGAVARDAKSPAPAPAAAAPARPAAEESPRPAPARPAADESPRLAPVRPAGDEKPRVAPARSAAEESPRVPAVAAKPAAALQPSPTGALAAKLRDEEGEEEATQIARGALIGAFSAAMMNDHAPASVADPLSMPGDEWFVGINGVPVGPIRLSELRAKAASGSITKESLVWRDGFEEWRPLKSFPELVAIVEESLSSARASMPFPVAAGSAPTALADPFAAQAPPPSTTPAVVAGGVSIDELQALRGRPRTSPAAWLAMVVAVGFGITLGFVFFGRADRSQGPAEKTAEKPATPVASTPVPAAVSPAEQKANDEQVISADSKTTPKSGSGSGKTTVAKTETEPKKTGGGLGLSGLSANGAKGPEGNGPSSTGSGSGGGQLDQAQLSGVVQRYTPSVKRSCWQPALDGRDKDAPTSARVAVAITISPSGSVQDATTSGDPRGYRGLAQCIAGRVRGWQFPPSGGTTTVNVPFVFVAQ